MFCHVYGRSNDTESWGQCHFFLYNSALLRFGLNKKNINLLAEFVFVYTGKLTVHGF